MPYSIQARGPIRYKGHTKWQIRVRSPQLRAVQTVDSFDDCVRAFYFWRSRLPDLEAYFNAKTADGFAMTLADCYV